MSTCGLAATLNQPLSSDSRELDLLPSSVSWLEVPLSGNGHFNVGHIRNRFNGHLICSTACPIGDNTDMMVADRHALIARAGAEFDLVELNVDRDASSDVLSKIPPEKRMISWFGPAKDLGGLQSEFRRLSRIPARYYKLACRAEEPQDALPILNFLKLQRAGNVIAYSSGPAGLWSRVLAPHFGSPLISGTLSPNRVSDGEPTIRQLIADYGFPHLRPIRRLHGIVGREVERSPSPRLHNSAYLSHGDPSVFVSLPTRDFSRFWHAFIKSEAIKSLGLEMAGLTVASPFKETVLEFAADLSGYTRKASSSNVMFRRNEHWYADTTDEEGVLGGLRGRRIALHRTNAAVVGCGGSGRAIAMALHQAGARVTLVNRSKRRGRFAQRLLKLPFVSLSNFDASGFSLVVNATPVGKDGDSMPFSTKQMASDALVVDLVYTPETTPLIASSRRTGHDYIDGREVLIRQVRRQFQMMTGLEMSIDPDSDVMRVDHEGGRVSRPTIAEGREYIATPSAEFDNTIP